MRRLFFIFLFFITFFDSKSQTITNVNIQGVDCNNPIGHITIGTDIFTPFYSWYVYNDSLSSWMGYASGVDLDSIIFSECGSYRVVIYDATYTPSDTGNYPAPCPMETDLRAHDNIKCFGDSTGMLKEIVSGGSPFPADSIHPSGEYYLYHWYKNGNLYSSGPNDTLLMNLSTGQYVVNVTDLTGCVFQPVDSATGLLDTSVVFQPNVLRIDSLDIDSVHCKGTNTGSFYINVKDGKRYETGNYYNYYLINVNNDTIRIIDRSGSSSNVTSNINPYYVEFDSLQVGYYTLYIIDSFGCSFDSSIYIPEPNDYTLFVSHNPNIICEQDSTWLIIDNVHGGNSLLEYNWLGTNPGDSIYVRAGIYQAVIYDIHYQCIDTVDYILTAPNTIYTDLTIFPAFCHGTNTGSVIVDSIYGGVTPYNVQWGGINPDSLYAGTYTIFITDALGCVYIDDIVVTENNDVALNPSLYSPSCFGYSDGSIAININGGNPPLNYNWLSGSGIPDSLFSVSAGIYVLHTTDDLGCFYIDSVILSEPDSLTMFFDGFTNPLSCNGGLTLINANITGGSGSYSLHWNTGNSADTNYQVVVPAGNYTLIVTDDHGCSNQEEIIITEPPKLTIEGSFVPSTCNTGGSASVIYAGGTEPISYFWSNEDTTASVSDLEGGDHWVIVTDDCGDTASYHFTIDSYILEIDINHYNYPINFAEVSIDPSSVGESFSYQWYDDNMNPINGAIDSIIFNLCQGWHFVTTTDNNSCEVTDSIYASFYFPMGGIINEATTTVYNDSLLWGAGPYSYLWDNGDITAHGNICPGFHRVWVTDVYGCEVVDTVTVDEIELSLNPSEILIQCDITNLDVELEVNVVGGVGDYTYLWSNGETVNPISLSLFPGKFSVEITDENSCVVDTTFHIAAISKDCIPNVFTPNSDGVNDVWNLEDAFLYLDTEVKVYGRYGNLVFQSIGYETPWDGKNKMGNPLEDGPYFYVIHVGNDIETIKGTVSIIR